MTPSQSQFKKRASAKTNPTRVVILYNEPVLAPTHPDAESEHEILYTVHAVTKVLRAAGFEVDQLGASSDPGALTASLQSHRPDVVFNLFEGTADHGGSEEVVAGLLEWLDIPFTGSPARSLCVARTKHVAKTLLQGAGLPTAEFLVVDKGPLLSCPIPWPAIVKPATQDASIGMDQGSVVLDMDGLNGRIDYLLSTYGAPVLVEQFIRGREFNVALIEYPDLQVLPISEIQFTDKDPGYWPIVTYDAKWTPGSRDYDVTPPQYPARLGARLRDRLGTLAREAFRLLDCRDYARVDFRVKAGGKPYILEVNPNADFSPLAGLSRGLSCADLAHADFTVHLVRQALSRARRGAGKTATAVPV